MIAACSSIFSMGILTYRGATAKEALGSELLDAGADLGEGAGLRGTTRRRSRARSSSRRSGCLNCHTYLGSGNHNLGAPDLSAEGAKQQGESSSRSPISSARPA